jgi:ABC-2 type transport system ATP-binding protein
LIDVHNLHKAYDRTIAVEGLSFSVAAGQILGLVGPNGAGKTTTMRAVSGILPFAEGRITVAGYDVEGDAIEVKRRLAYLPDEPQLFPDLSVEQHLAFIASVYEVRDAQEKAARLLEEFHLASHGSKTGGSLSRGMRQKLAICCAYLYDPVALLFDEPLTGLDPHGIRTFKRSVRERAERGAAVIVSSHLLAMVEDICTHVLVLAEGKQKFLGPLAELRAKFAEQESEASLESVFFRATEETVAVEATATVY